MATIIEQQKQMVQTIFKHIQKEKDNLDKLYSDFINKLNEGNPSNKSYTDIDELFISTVPQAKSFYDQFTENDVELLHWYDMNQKQFINPISGYNHKIIKKYNFRMCTEILNHNISTKNIINFIHPHKGCFKLNISIDDHLNIIIPEIKTIIINNYGSLPIYTLYFSHLKLNNQLLTVYNSRNETDVIDYAKICNSINFQNYITSEDDRKNRWSDGVLFQDILDFIGYQSMIDEIKPQLDFMQLISVNKPVEKVEDPKKDLVHEGISYDTILFNQIKDLQSQVEHYKKLVSQLEKDK
jgi:hypothetical protein